VLLPTDGALECLLGLHAEGYRIALASSATRDQVALVVEKLGIRRGLHALVSAADVVRGKPEPDLFLEAARRLRVEPAVCLVVEDAVLGIRAARAAGMAAVALVDAGRDGQLHRAAGALSCLTSLRELTPGRVEELAARKN
jgi:HAD superfamily hydrolase (TIGR01509 family)